MTKELEVFKTIYNNIDYLTTDVIIESDEVNDCLKTIKGQLQIIEQALQRLEAIDNPNSKESLNDLEMLSDCAEAMREAPSSNWIKYAQTEAELDLKLYLAYSNIQQTLLKAQEQDFNYKNIVIPFFDELVKIYGITDIDEILDKIKKQKKALNIIKEKTVSVFQLSCCKKVYEYNTLKFKDSEKLTQEEFNLLKEVFKK